jgi:hypothetical protein
MIGFFKWFYRDRFIFDSESIDKKSKKILPIICFLGGFGWSAFILWVWIIENPYEFRRNPEVGILLILLGIIGSWVGYRVLRFLLWCFTGISKSKIGAVDDLSSLCRKLIPILVVLALLPIVLHLWFQMTERLFQWGNYWDLIRIGNDVSG